MKNMIRAASLVCAAVVAGLAAAAVLDQPSGHSAISEAMPMSAETSIPTITTTNAVLLGTASNTILTMGTVTTGVLTYVNPIESIAADRYIVVAISRDQNCHPIARPPEDIARDIVAKLPKDVGREVAAMLSQQPAAEQVASAH